MSNPLTHKHQWERERERLPKEDKRIPSNNPFWRDKCAPTTSKQMPLWLAYNDSGKNKG